MVTDRECPCAVRLSVHTEMTITRRARHRSVTRKFLELAARDT
jgi:hypothetical protein